MTKIGTVINFCSLDHRFIRDCVRAVAPFSHRVVVPYADHLFDGTPEEMAVIEGARKANPEAEFVPFAYHHSITEMLRPRFWHNFARWVGLSHLPADCDWVLFLDADEIVETDRFAAFLLKGGFETYDYLYFANYWYFREPRFRARQIEDSPAMVKRAVINVNRIFHEKERATFRRLPNGLRRVAGPDGRPMFHHYSWVMTEAEMLRKIGTWGHSLDTDKDWETLVKAEFSNKFSGKDFVHGYDFDVVEPLIRMDAGQQEEMAVRTHRAAAPDSEQRGTPLPLTPLAISCINLKPLSRFVADPNDLGYFLDTDFKEHYRLLAFLGTLFSGETLIDIGTCKGYSALALAYNFANQVVSYDIVDNRMMHASQEIDNIEFRIGDILSDRRLLHAPLIFLDISHDGASERRIYDFLDQNGYEGILVLDDIHLNSAMASFWKSIPRPKQDITGLGHVTGTGIVYFRETGAGKSTVRPRAGSSGPGGALGHNSTGGVDPYRNKENYLTPNPRPDQWRGHVNSLVMAQFETYLRGTVADLGCNHGAMTLLAAEHSRIDRVIGLDLNQSALKLGQSTGRTCRLRAPVTFIQSSLLRMALADASMDAMVSFHTLEHLYPSDLAPAATEIRRVLKPGGHFILSIPYEDAYYTPGQHVSFFNEKNLEDLFASNGFEKITCFRDRRNREDCLTAVFRKPSAISRIALTDREPACQRAKKTDKDIKKMHIGFHSNQLGLRGTEVALYDYAFYNREILGNESVIISDASGDMQGLEKFQKNFEVLLYDDFVQVEGFVKKRGIDAVYFQKAGNDDGKLVSNARNLVHAVFQSFEPHGDVYAYISRWLAREMTGERHPFVPYMVRLPESEENFRKQLGIPEDAVVFGRHGGLDQFNILYAQRVVVEVARARPDLFFLFMNTDRFCEPMANIIHLNATWDLAAKVGFINSCDAMLHARVQGETFGLAIAEFLLRDKPVIASMGGIDKNHLEMLGDRGRFYGEPVELFDHLIGFEKAENRGKYRELVAQFSPRQVMKRFEDVFLGS